MVITQNIGALYVQRQLGINNNFKMKSTAKLASGYKINKAADDAAGLSISEKMRRQVRGLDQGLENMQDGISLCQVADGALNEVQDMMHRMTELAIQAANGTNSDADRAAINAEVDAMKAEINRIGTTTQFNQQPVFRGDVVQVSSGSTLENPTANGPFFQLLGDDVSHTGYMQEPLAKAELENMDKTGMNGGNDNPFVSVHANFDKLINKDNNIKALANTGFYVNCCTDCCPNHVKFVDEAGIKKDGHEISIGIKKDDGTYFTSAEEFCKVIVSSPAIAEPNHVEFACKDSTLYLFDIDNNSWDESEKKLAYFCDIPDESTTGTSKGQSSSGDVRIQMSGEVSDGMLLKIGGLSTETLHIDDCNCLTCEAADKMIAAVDLGTRLLSSQRSRIGALTNRLEHAVNVNSNTLENTTAAESRIRDTDMAKTMVEHAKYNILEQTGQAMLAQANQTPQSVLSLLQ